MDFGARPKAGEQLVSDDFVFACPLSELGDDTVLACEIAGQNIAIAQSNGKVYAISDECTHGKIALSDGEVEDGQIECWLHGSRFDLETGQPLNLPATKPVTTYEVRIEADEVQVKIPK